MAGIEPNDKDDPHGMARQMARQRTTLPNGKKKPQTVTCHDETRAERLKALVDEAGNRMPAAKVLEAYGLQWVLGRPSSHTAAAAGRG